MWHDLLRHGRFLVSFAFGLALGLAAFRMQTIDRVLVFSVSFNLCFLILSALALRRSDAESLRARADENDEGMKVIVPLAGGAVLTSLVAILLTILVGLSRIYLGVHYPTDVIAGWIAGLSWALFCWSIARWLQNRNQIEDDETTPEEV